MITVALLFYLLNIPWDNDPMIIQEDTNRILFNEKNKKLFLKNYLTPREDKYKESNAKICRKEVLLANRYLLSLSRYDLKSRNSKELTYNVRLMLNCVKSRKELKFKCMISWKLQNLQCFDIYNEYRIKFDISTHDLGPLTLEMNRKFIPIEKNLSNYIERKCEGIMDPEIVNWASNEDYFCDGGMKYACNEQGRLIFLKDEKCLDGEEYFDNNVENKFFYDEDKKNVSSIIKIKEVIKKEDYCENDGKKIIEDNKNFNNNEKKHDFININSYQCLLISTCIVCWILVVIICYWYYRLIARG